MTQSQITTPRHYQQLTLEERGQIQALKQAGFTVTKITEQVHRDKSTVSRELKRGTTEQICGAVKHYRRYFAETGAAVYEKHRAACRPRTRFDQCPDFYAELVVVLRARPRIHSVDSFVHTYKQTHPERPCPSTPTVYRDIDKGLLAVRNGDLPMKPRRRVKRDTDKHVRTNKRIYGQSIEERPTEVENRQVVGHWEGDLVKGTRVEIIIKLPRF